MNGRGIIDRPCAAHQPTCAELCGFVWISLQPIRYTVFSSDMREVG